jgi:hypothetical protein
LDELQQRRATVLLVDEGKCGASPDRVLAHGSLSSVALALGVSEEKPPPWERSGLDNGGW